jgi:DNA end-binding protein Ku
MPLSLPATPPEPALPTVSRRDGPAAAAPRGRASWSGLLRLSLVAVPVKAYPATATPSESRCHQLHAGCGQRIRYEKHCPQHGKVDAAAIVSGYPYAPDQYVVIDDDQLDQLRPAPDRALGLERFLDADQFDPALFSGRSLYLVPDGRAAQHPYAVVHHALQERRKWALGRVVLAGHRRVALVRPAGGLLALHILHYPAQVRPRTPWEAELQVTSVLAAEQELAVQLLDASAQPVDWSAYRDDSAEQFAALVEAALQGRALTAAVVEPVPVLPLLEALKQSVAQAVRAQDPAAAGPRRRARQQVPARRKP